MTDMHVVFKFDELDNDEEVLGIFSTQELALNLVEELSSKRKVFVNTGSYSYQIIIMEVDKHYSQMVGVPWFEEKEQ